ncbi:covalently-linked cell wall protein [Colletotrichum higginsianum]|nr:covalently-linked cell wall protein [Colletotrichum higginsianum]
MRFSAFITFALGGMAVAMPQASASVSGALAPEDGPPSGCETNFDGNFGLTVVELGKRSLDKRGACTGAGSLDLTLKDSVLTDSQNRTGSIVANFQFQFDGPPQAGVIYTSGFSVCSNGSLALGGSTTFYRCLSGNFYNLYDRHWAEQCSPIHLSVLPCGENAPVPSGGQIVGTTMVATTLVTVIEDGQPQVVPTTIPVPICQIDDGQIQGHTTPCGELPPITRTASQPAALHSSWNSRRAACYRYRYHRAHRSACPVDPSGLDRSVQHHGARQPARRNLDFPRGHNHSGGPPVAAGQSLAPASLLALVATLFAALYIV